MSKKFYIGFIFLFAGLLTSGFCQISMNFKSADVRNVFRILAEAGNVNIVLDKNVSGKITVTLKNVDFNTALKSVLLADNLMMKKSGSVIFITKSKAEIPKTDIEIIKLKYINAEDVAKTVRPFLSRFGKIEVFKEKILGGWGVSGITGAGTSGTTGYTQQGTVGYTQQGTAGTSMLGENTRMPSAPNEKPRTLILQEIPQNIEKIKQIIKELDKPKHEILIGVKIVEVNKNYLKNLGINWNYQETGYSTTGGMGVNSSLGNISPVQPGVATGLSVAYSKLTGTQFTAELQALEQENKAKDLSSPKILVMEDHQAVILVGEEYPVFQTNIIPGTTPPTLIESFYEYEPVGVDLLVIPRVVDSNTVNLIVHPQVSSLGANVVGATGLTMPIINTREIDADINIRNGSTIILGGLISKQKNTAINKIPLLGDIPLLGKLFQSKQITNVNMELLIFITPKIL